MLGGPGQDAAPGDPRRASWPTATEPDAPGRPRGARHRADRPGGLQPLPVHLGPLDRADRRRRPDHGARRGQEPRARRRASSTRRVRRGARRAARARRAVRRHPPLAGARRLRPHRRLRRADRALVRRRRGDRRGARASRGGPAGDAAPRPRARRGRCATARTPTSSARATAWPAPRRWWDGVVQHAGTRPVVPQPLRRRRRVAAGARARRRRPGAVGGGHHQARQPVGAPRSRRRSPTPSTGALGATRCPPSAAWSPSPARSTRTWPRSSRPARRPTSSSPSPYDAEAVEALVARRKATRLLSRAGPRAARAARSATCGDTALVQDADELVADRASWRCVDQGRADRRAAARPGAGLAGLRAHDVQRHRAWRAAAWPSGVGAGQQSRVVGGRDRRRQGRRRAPTAPRRRRDAFFPFPDGLEALRAPGWPRSSSPAGRCATPRSSRPPTPPVSPWCSPANATSGTEEAECPRQLLDGEAVAGAPQDGAGRARGARSAAEGARPGSAPSWWATTRRAPGTWR